MSHLLKKKKYKRALFSKPTIVVLLLLLLLVGNATFNVYDKERATQAKVEEAQSDLEGLKEREVELQEKIEALDTRHGIEREIRDTFGFVKEGEKVLVIIEGEEAVVEEVQRKTLWSRLVDLFR